MHAPSPSGRASKSSRFISTSKVTDELCSLHRLIEDLSRLQSRLGTPLEAPGDYDLVRELGHEIRNKLHVMQLWTEIGVIDMPLGDRAD